MPQWVSKEGQWHPAKEYAVLAHLAGTGREIYNGPDRAALKQLWDMDKTGGVTTLGENFRQSPDFLEMIRKRGFKDTEEYLDTIGYDQKKIEADFKEKAEVIKIHDLPKRMEAIERLGGGTDMSGQNKSYVGGMGDAVIREASND